MSITRINYFSAKEGSAQAVYEILQSAMAMVRSSQGHIASQLLHSQENNNEFVIIEEWESVNMHKAAADNIPVEQISKIMPLLAAPPRGSYYQSDKS